MMAIYSKQTFFYYRSLVEVQRTRELYWISLLDWVIDTRRLWRLPLAIANRRYAVFFNAPAKFKARLGSALNSKRQVGKLFNRKWAYLRALFEQISYIIHWCFVFFLSMCDSVDLAAHIRKQESIHVWVSLESHCSVVFLQCNPWTPVILRLIVDPKERFSLKYITFAVSWKYHQIGPIHNKRNTTSRNVALIQYSD